MDGIEAETMHILVVDDDDLDRGRVARLLRQVSPGADLTEVASAQEAMTLVRSRAFDCVVLDNQLPDGCGADLLPELRAGMTRSCPVIMVTGAGSEELAAEVMRAGAADYLPKGRLTREILDRAISRSIETSRLQDQLRTVGEALAASEAKYRAIVEEQVELVCVARPDLTLTFANAAFLAHHGVAGAQVPGTSFLDYVAAEDRTLVCEHLQDVCISRAAKRLECRSMSADANAVRWVAWTHRALRNKDGGVTAIQSVGRDVSDMVRGREAVARLAAIVDTSADAIASTDFQGRITSWNRAAEHLFGYRAKDAIGRPIDIIVPPDRLVEAATLAQRVRAGESLVEFQTVRMRKNAVCIDVAITHSPIRDAHGKVIGVSKIMRDIGERKRLERELRDSERQFRELYEETPAMLHCVDSKGRLTSVSDTWLVELGYARNEVVGRPFLEFLTPASCEVVQERLLPSLRQTGRCNDLACQVRRGDGGVMDVRLSARMDRDPAGYPGRSLVVLTDVTEKNRLARVLAEEHERLRVTLRSIGDAVITTDGAGLVEFLNPVAEKLTGWAADEARGQPVQKVFHVVAEDDQGATQDPVASCLAQARPVVLASRSLLISRDGNEFGIADSTAPIVGPGGHCLGAVIVFHDVTEQRLLVDDLRFRATHDPLTGLLNRMAFEERLAQTLARARSGAGDMALLFIDLDHFKRVNDNCGHAAGDRVLRQIGGALQRCIRDRDTLARLGGDEFGVILEHCPAQQAQRIARQICTRVKDFRFVHEEHRFPLGASVGLVVIDGSWASEAALLQAADRSCYAAKEAGGDGVHVRMETEAPVPEAQ